MSTTIIEPSDIAEDRNLGPEDDLSNLTAIKEPENKGMEFHVQMNGYTLSDMDDIIAEAAARMIVGRSGSPTKLAKDIEAKVVALTTDALNARLEKVSADIIDQPMTPNFGDKKPTTMREMIGLFGREYLTEMVNDEGKTGDAGWRDTRQPRIQWIAERAMQRKFKNEIEAATNKIISEIQAEIKANHDAFLKQEKARLAEALAKLAGAA